MTRPSGKVPGWVKGLIILGLTLIGWTAVGMIVWAVWQIVR